jgi:citrate synthase
MADDAGEVIFATARTAGWIVHALAEYRERPLRLRPVGRYTPSEAGAAAVAGTSSA